ncbi:hypothetical protein EPN54_04400 [bacterium]|nr:MAG: hypothetical protein EPN54_04400 [bacterium]
MNLLLIGAAFILAGMIFGAFVYFNAPLAIKMQMKFYEKINWRMEPVSMQKEIKNTQIMGLFLFVFCLLAIVYIKLFSVEGWIWAP